MKTRVKEIVFNAIAMKLFQKWYADLDEHEVGKVLAYVKRNRSYALARSK